jgi:hypothetical protein
MRSKNVYESKGQERNEGGRYAHAEGDTQGIEKRQDDLYFTVVNFRVHIGSRSRGPLFGCPARQVVWRSKRPKRDMVDRVRDVADKEPCSSHSILTFFFFLTKEKADLPLQGTHAARRDRCSVTSENVSAMFENPGIQAAERGRRSTSKR